MLPYNTGSIRAKPWFLDGFRTSKAVWGFGFFSIRFCELLRDNSDRHKENVRTNTFPGQACRVQGLSPISAVAVHRPAPSHAICSGHMLTPNSRAPCMGVSLPGFQPASPLRPDSFKVGTACSHNCQLIQQTFPGSHFDARHRGQRAAWQQHLYFQVRVHWSGKQMSKLSMLPDYQGQRWDIHRKRYLPETEESGGTPRA